MRKLETGEIALTDEEATNLRLFIDGMLDRAWDRYTDHVIVENTSWEDGKRRMDPDMYDFAHEIQRLQFE